MTVDGHSESVKVIVRCRPFNQREKDMRCKSVVSMEPSRGQVSILNPHDVDGTPPKIFTFDGVYDVDSTTEQIYNDIAYPLVEGVLEAYAGTVFAYGQTGCGKSFTMQGAGVSTGADDPASPHRGIVPRAFEHIFEAIATSDDTKYLVQASYLEIYNEEIRDLLGKDSKRKLELKDHPKIGAFIPGLSTHAVHDVGTMMHLMTAGWRNRSVGATLMNADSSRSHSVFTVSLEMMPIDGGEPTKGKLNLVDLAGSERQTKTGCTGDRLKEATKINLSLSALGNVISALVDGKSKHIPYRDSKLTRLLQDSLGGETRTLMIACLSPADNNYDESLSTLRYANRAKKIVNKPVKNENPVDALLREYQEEITRLKAIVEGGAGRRRSIAMDEGGATTAMAPENSQLEEEKNRLKMEYEQMMEELRIKYEREQRSHAMLQQELSLLRLHYEQQMQRLNVTDASGAPSAAVADGTGSSNGGVAAQVAPTQQGSSMAAPKPEIELNNALKRLQELEEQMVGGEKAHDKELKEKRLRKKKAAEKRLRILADALQQVDEDDKVLITVYEDIQEELKAKTELLKKEKQRVRTLEREIKDLQSEFEFDRMDYLETIRRQDQQNRLLQQILDKVQPCLRRDCNYSSVDRVKAESTWDEDAQKWVLPDLVVAKTRLPAAASIHRRREETSVGAADNNNNHNLHLQQVVNGDGVDDDDSDDKFLQKLERGEQEDIAGNYFRPKRAKELLLKAQEESSVAKGVRLSNLRNNMNGLTNSSSGGGGFLYNAVLNASNQNSPSNSSTFDHSIGGGSSPPSMMIADSGGIGVLHGRRGGVGAGKVGAGVIRSGPTSPEIAGLIRKPTRLDSLGPIVTATANTSSNNNGDVVASTSTSLLTSKKMPKRKTTNGQNTLSFGPPGTVSTAVLEL